MKKIMARMRWTCYCCVLLSWTLGDVRSEQCEKSSNTAEDQIRSELMCNYDVESRPIKNQNGTIDVGIMLFPTYITADIGQADTITLHVHIGMVWTDEYLVWNDTAHNVSSIRIWNNKIWMPDIVSFNMENTPSYRDFPNECEVYFYGEVLCLMHAKYEAYCESDYRKWPYDTLTCSLQFRSWFDKGHSIRLAKSLGEGFDLKMFKPSLYWDFNITNVSSDLDSESIHTSDSMNITYPSINYTISIKRHSSVYTASVVAPIVVMALLTLISMTMSVETFERVYLLTISLFGHFWYLTLVLSWSVPADRDNCALIVVICRNSWIMTAAVLVLTSPLKKLLLKTNEAPKLVYWTIEFTHSRFGRWIVYPSKKLDDMSAFIGQDVGEIATHMGKRNNEEWTFFVHVFDRVIFYIILLTYSWMFLMMWL